MIRKVLPGKYRKMQLVLALVGITSGLALALLAFQIMTDFSSLFKTDKELLRNDFLVINKGVSIVNSLMRTPSSFSETEISEIEKQKGVKKVGKFTAGKFYCKINSVTALNQTYALRSDLFLESVPTGFLDIKDIDWSWKPGQPDVPIIFPEDYINIYNFVFAPGANQPLLPEEVLKMATIDLSVISGTGENIHFNGRIAGFSNRINSILAPQQFVEYANKAFSSEKSTEPFRLIIEADKSALAPLQKFFDSKSYNSNPEKMGQGKFNLIANIVIWTSMAVGFIIIGLALLGFVQFSQLMLLERSYEIETLFWLGFTKNAIFAVYRLFFAKLLMAVFVSSMLVLFIVKWQFSSILKKYGFDISVLPSLSTCLFSLVVITSVSIIQLWMVRKQIGKTI